MNRLLVALLLAALSTNPTDATAAFPTTNSHETTDIKKGCYISGHVIEKKSEENIPFANIYIIETKQGTVSNEAGQFEFKNMTPGEYTLRVSAMGYRTETKKVTVSKEYATVVHFEMLDESLKIEELVVSANRNEVSRR
ncbi:MAG: carboxypeptidase-like regulatory domain-containing protein, partial [Bacteroidaceae bacterium]|nr:carboxypeptidase-like regulatory domain-containing protein [Bacteroidaceae bacterium]